MRSTGLQHFLTGTACIAVAIATPAAATTDQRRDYHLPEQELGSALLALSKTSGSDIYFSADAVQGKRAPRLDGIFTLRQAVEAILSGSGLVAVERNGSILIRGRSGPPLAAADENADEAIVVTGTRIRGAPVTSPVTMVRREEAERSGQTDLGQVIRDLPQNFSGGQNPTIAGSGQGGTSNGNGSSALNLRGLGADASLTLINGHRVAFDAIYQGVDISAIPLAAIERLDVSADGASALYGSDAVGGVANVILRRKVEGVVTSASLGAATDGGAVSQHYSLVAGPAWKSGSVMFAADYRDTSEIAGRHRSYTSKLAPDGTMIAGLEQISLVVAGEQSLSDGLTFEIDGNYLHRSVPQCVTVTAVAPASCFDNGALASAKVDSWSVSPTLRLDLAMGWEMRLGGTFSQSHTSIVTINRVGGAETVRALPRYDNSLKSVELGAEGPLFNLPGGLARMALGAGYRSNRLQHDLRRVTAGVTTPVMIFDETRDVAFLYGELFLPLISADNGLSLLRKLQLVGALRYEDHHGVGRVATPKIGLVYSPFEGLEIKANWGKSFKAPTLYQLGQASNAQLIASRNYAPSPPSAFPVLYLFGGNPNLGPERATTWNVSAALTPLEGLRAEASYFRIRYRDRVATPLAATTTAFLPAFSDLVQLNPSADDVLSAIGGISGIFTNLTTTPFNPGQVSAIFRNTLQNVSLQSVEGVDLALSYTRPIGERGRLSIKGAVTYLDSKRQVAANLPVVPQSGVVFTPAHWRGRLNASFDREDFALAVITNFTGSTKDNRFTPVTTVGSFTTLDTVLTVRSADRRGLLANVAWRVAAQNLLNAKPSIIRTSTPALPPYDSLNQSPLGRVITLTLTKVW